jgi:hypothetical protein
LLPSYLQINEIERTVGVNLNLKLNRCGGVAFETAALRGALLHSAFNSEPFKYLLQKLDRAIKEQRKKRRQKTQEGLNTKILCALLYSDIGSFFRKVVALKYGSIRLQCIAIDWG